MKHITFKATQMFSVKFIRWHWQDYTQASPSWICLQSVGSN